MSVAITLSAQSGAKRSFMLAKPNNRPLTSTKVQAMFCWFGEFPLDEKSYLVLHLSTLAECSFRNIIYKLDVQKLTKSFEDKEITLNDIFRATIETSQPLWIDPYRINRVTGSLIIIDKLSNETVAAGMIVSGN